MKTYIIEADLDYVQGHLRDGHKELKLTEEQYQKYQSLSKEKQYEWIWDEGKTVVDDWEVEDVGDINNIYIREIND